MCEECHGVEFIANGDKMFYNSFNELTDDLKDKFKSKAKGWNLIQAKEGFISFINELNKRGDELIGDYISNKNKTLIKFNRCNHIPPDGITPSSYKSGRGCRLCCNNTIKNRNNKRYGRLVAIKIVGTHKYGNALWLCKCDCGNEIVVPSNYLTSGNTKSCGCLRLDKTKERWESKDFQQMMSKIHSGDSNKNWNGGITPISNHLRSLTIQWDRNVRQYYNKQCALTGIKCTTRNSTVHHLYGFNTIVIDAHNAHNIEVKPQVKDYTDKELKLLEDYVAEWHKDTSNGVLLSKEVHYLFHHCKDKDGNIMYGKGSNTPEQYEEFKQRYLNGEFDDLLGDDLDD